MLRRLLALFRRDSFPFEPSVQWTLADAKGYSAFSTTETGKRFQQRISNAVTQAAIWAVDQKGHEQYACGYAKGVATLAAHLNSHLSPPAAHSRETTEDRELAGIGPEILDEFNA